MVQLNLIGQNQPQVKQTKATEGVNKDGQGNGFAKTNGGDTYEGFKTESNLQAGVGVNKNQNAGSGGITLSNYSSAVSGAKSSATSGTNQKEQMASSTDAHVQASSNAVNEYNDHMSIMGQEVGNIAKADKNLNNIGNKQDAISNWISQNEPTAEEMVAKKEELTEQALNIASQFGEFSSIEEFNEFAEAEFDPEQFEQLEEKKAEREEKMEEMEALPDDDPQKEVLQQEIEGLDGEIESLNTTKNGFDLSALSDAMGQIGELSAQIGELDAAITEYNNTVDTKINELNGLDTESKAQQKTLNTAQVNATTATQTVADTEGDLKPEEEEIDEGLYNLQTAGTITSAAGGVLTTAGSAFLAIPEPTSVTKIAGFACLGGGMVATGAGTGMTTVAQNKLAENENSGVTRQDAANTLATGIGNVGKGFEAGIKGYGEVTKENRAAANAAKNAKKTQTTPTQ